jgi:hypothetical protein
VRWIDDYARRMTELTEPEWDKMIDNPESRWYKEKYEYQMLFKLGKKDAGGRWQA